MPRNRWDIISKLIIDNKIRTVADIGISKGQTVSGIKRNLHDSMPGGYQLEAYYGIDPFLEPYFKIEQSMLNDFNNWLPFKMVEKTSNDFFTEYKDLRVDLIFIDGDHRPEQYKKDLSNSKTALKEGGILIGHDYIPALLDRKAYATVNADWTNEPYYRISEYIDSFVGEENLNFEQDKRVESGKPVFIWWTFKKGDKFSKVRE